MAAGTVEAKILAKRQGGSMRFVSIVGGFIALLLLKDPLSAAGDSAPQFIGMWGSYGSGPGQFNYPYGIALSLDGNVYVSDQYNYRIAAFTADGSLVTSWGSQGHNDGQFYGTIGLAVDASGRVFVADNGNNRVQVFEGNGAFVRQWYARGARDISLGPDGLVYVADFDYSGRSLIEVFTSEGAPVRAWGSGTFGSIASIKFNAVGELYVADEGGFFYSVPQSISRWTPLGVLLNRWGTAGSAVGQLGGAAGIAVDGLGRVYVAEHQTNRVDVFGSDGTFLASWGTLGSGPGQFDEPVDVAIGQNGQIYVVDMYNHRIQRFGDSAVAVSAVSLGRLRARYR